jgi:uncharacterized protein with HEPN domain
MPRSLYVYLTDIQLSIDSIESFTQGKNIEDFVSDGLLQAAVERKFSIIGEVFAQMETHYPGQRQRIEDVTHIVVFRNRLIHAYSVIDPLLVFSFVQGPMRSLKAQIASWIAELDPDVDRQR